MTAKLSEEIIAYGHENILATHETTFEITKEIDLTKKGTCIIAVSANKGLADLSPAFKENLKKENAKLNIRISAGETADIVNALGSPQLVLEHPRDMVIRRSAFVCSRTLGVKADKAANDLSRKLVEKLRNPRQEVKITMIVRF